MAKARAEVTIGLRTRAFRRGLARMKRGLSQFAARVKGIGRGLANFGRMAGRSFLVAAAGITFAVREASKFRAQMAQVNTMLGAGADIGKFTEDVRVLSAELGIAKDELALGLYQTLSASVPPENAIAFLAEAAKAAVGGATDIETAVDGLTTVINAYGMKASAVGKVSDEMFTAVKRGKTTFGELSQSIGQVANIASVAGVKTEELFAAYATLTRQGIKTDKATTGLRQALIAILKPSEDLQKKFDELGVSGSELLRQEGLAGAFEKIAKMAGGSTEELVKLIPNVRALPAFLGLTGDNAAVAASDLAAMANAAGKAGEAFDKMEVAKQWPRLWQSILGLVERFGDVVSRVAQPAVEGLSKLLQQIATSPKFAAFLDRVGKVSRQLIGSVGAILQGGEGRKLALEGFKDIVVGAFQAAVAAAGEMLLKLAPKIGAIIGTVAKSIFEAPLRAAARKTVAKELVESEFKAEGKSHAARGFGSTLTRDNQAEFDRRVKAKNEELKKIALDNALRKVDKDFETEKATGADRVKAGLAKLDEAGKIFEKNLADFKSKAPSFVDSLGIKDKAPIEELLAPKAGGAGKTDEKFSELRRIGANIVGGAGGKSVEKEQLSMLQALLKESQATTKAVKANKTSGGTF